MKNYKKLFISSDTESEKKCLSFFLSHFSPLLNSSKL